MYIINKMLLSLLLLLFERRIRKETVWIQKYPDTCGRGVKQQKAKHACNSGNFYTQL